MSSATYALEHFYYGQFARGGKAEGDLRLLAASPGVSTELAAEAIKAALLPPLPDHAWALVRGRKNIPFILVQSGLGEAGQTMLHFILPPPDMLRALGGNLRALLRLIETPLPTYDRLGDRLKPLTLPPAEAPAPETQIDDILNLMSSTQNRIPTIEALLSAIVQGVPVAVTGAPPVLETRTLFVQGLLALLPPSARFGVTFATHSKRSTKIDAQIRFMASAAPDDAVTFDWESGALSGPQVEDDYSRFIISQLRLDADLVISQTRRLTAVAAWRIKHGDRLADALGYAAHRFRMDEALLNNQPVESADVSRVLAEDPTLSRELRIAYARHLLAFSLALEDMSHADPIAVMLRQQPELESAIQRQLDDAINEGKAGLIYPTLASWLGNPLGPVGSTWVELTHRAALAHMTALVKSRDLRQTGLFLETLHHAEPGVEISRIVPRLVEMALPLSVRDDDLSLTLFMLAVDHLETDVLRRMIATPKFIAHLPPSLSRLAPHLTGADPGLCPAGLLMDTAQAFGDEWRDLVLIRLAEIAVAADRADIVDTSALAGLVRLLPTPWALQYNQVLRWIAINLSTDQHLSVLDDPGPTYILQILLATGAYADLANEMLHQARLLYPGDRQTAYLATIRRVFAETPMKTDDVPLALNVIAETGIRSAPLTMAYIGALEGHDWSAALDPVADDATRMLLDNRPMLEVIDPAAMIALMRFHIKRRDVQNTVRVAGLLAQVAAREQTKGVGIIGRMYQMMDWDDRVKIARAELLRRFVRDADDDAARRAVSVFGREFGVQVQRDLEATYTLKRMMGGADLLAYAGALHITAEFLYDTLLAYADPKRLPTLGTLLSDLDSMPGGLSADDRRLIMRELLGLARTLVVLGESHLTHRPRDFNRHIEGLLAGKTNPVSAFDVLWVMSGYFTKGKRYPLRLETLATSVLHPLGERSAPTLKEQVTVINTLLRHLIRAFPPDRPVGLTAAAVRGELESLWGGVPLLNQREIVRDLAADLQRVAELGALIVETGTAKAVEDGPLSRRLEEFKQQPKNTLEFYRLVYGYFRTRLK